MQLLKLCLKNLNSFRQEVEIDFESSPLNDASLLAITGPTGSGKTTLLDALCVGLYGKTPRLSSTGNQNPGNLLSQGKTEGFAEVLFAANGTRYLSEWRVKRNRRGELKPEGKLINTDTHELITDRLSSRGKSRGISELTVSDAIASILGLDFDAFTRSVMLAQGDFAAFLKAKAEERRQILEATTGIAIYDQLKKVLNEKVRSLKNMHAQAEASFNAIPATTREEIEEAEARLTALGANAKSLQQKRQAILSEKEREIHRVRLHEQLIQVKIRHTKLLSQQTEIDQKQSELELARRSAKLRPERQAFQSEKQDLEDAQSAFQKAERALAHAQREYDASLEGFAEIDGQYRAVLQEREMKMEAYNVALAEQIKAQAQFDTLKERQDGLQTIEEQINELSRKLTSQEEESSALAQQIDTDNAFLRDNLLPENSDQRLGDARAILVQLTGKREFLAEKSKAQKESQSKHTRLCYQLEKLEKEREELIAEKTDADTTLEQAEVQLKTQQDEGSLETWEVQKRQAQQMQPVARKYEDAAHRLNEIQRDSAQIIENKSAINDKLISLDQELAVQIEIVGQAEEKVKRCEAEREIARMANHVSALRQQLHKGDPCLVCGALEHPWANKKELDAEKQVELASQNLSQAETELKAESDKLSEMQQQRIRTEGDGQNLEQQINQSHERMQKLETTIISAQTEWQQVYPKNEIEADWLQRQIDAADDSIRKLRDAMTAHTEASNAQKLITQRLNDHERELQRVKSELVGTKDERRALIAEIETLNDEILEIEAEFWKSLPDDFASERAALQPEEAIDRFAAQIDAVKTREKRLNQKQHLFDRLSDRIEEGTRKLESEQKRLMDADAEINRYRTEGEKLLTSARAKTGGLRAEDAIQKLEAKVQEKTDLRNHAEEALREKENALAYTHTNHNNAESRCAECLERFDVAHQTYSVALEESGFASPETHEQAFRDDSWMKKSTEEIDAYRQRRHATEEEVRSLQKHFADQPFDSQVMERIQETERTVDREIQSTDQEIGQLRQRIGELEENFRRREEQGIVLEKARKESDRWARLQDCMPQNSLRDFALEHMFDFLIRLANKQLEDLTGRYRLKVKGMQDMVVIDKWNANEERPVETLSGGESFLASLSLALALSEMSRGRTQLNSLFLDEGFGTLDTKTLDTAISALEGLRMAGKSIVVISHVGELTRRIPVQIAVEKMGNGSSRVHIRG
ncbi:AAA family ATPase [Candidatus Poribacteria bacterium]|nr:AAA family ATPase [Candidatus Poribacteria bacterium]